MVATILVRLKLCASNLTSHSIILTVIGFWAKRWRIVRMGLMDRAEVSQRAKQAVIDCHALIDGHFIFADGDHATTKVEMDQIWNHPKSLATILKLLAQAQGLPPADVILGVPRGGQALAEAIAKGYSDVPMAKLERVSGGSKQDFCFVTAEDRERALKAQAVRIYEDVVTTLSSVAGVVRLLDPDHQSIHSLAIWRRGEVKAKYRQGVTDHYLVEELLPSFAPGECPVCNKV